MISPFHHLPDRALLRTQEEQVPLSSSQLAARRFRDISWELAETTHGLDVSITAQETPLKELVLRWDLDFPQGCRFLGGPWERGYGSQEWRGFAPDRVMAWYFAADNGQEVLCFGVKAQPHALCWWSADPHGFSLHLDLRCGGEGVKLRGRTLPAASVVFRRSGTTAFQALQRFFKELCPVPLLPDHPVYGSNNWYYAYGNSSHSDILQDADYLASLTQGLENRPYMVIDDGWQSLHNMEPGYNGGPWRAGNEKFPDMGALAREIANRGARPGIWIRLLWNRDPQIPESWRSKRDREYLDPTVPEVLSYIQEDLRTLRRWGYELIKHDFSTFDIFGRWGFQMGSQITEGGWRFADETVTSAEAVLNFYKAVREAYLRHGVDTIMAPFGASPQLMDAIRDTEQKMGRGIILVDTPTLNVDNNPQARQEAEALVKESARRGAKFCLLHHSCAEQLVNKNKGIIDRLDDYTKMIRDAGMIPGLSAHMPELVVYSDANGYDVETYIQIFNCMGFLMQVEIETVASIIQNAKKPVMTIKSMAAGRCSPYVGLTFSWNAIRPQDMVTLGAFSPQEVEEDVEISLAAIEHRFPDLEKRSSPNQNQAAFG